MQLVTGSGTLRRIALLTLGLGLACHGGPAGPGNPGGAGGMDEPEPEPPAPDAAMGGHGGSPRLDASPGPTGGTSGEGGTGGTMMADAGAQPDTQAVSPDARSGPVGMVDYGGVG